MFMNSLCSGRIRRSAASNPCVAGETLNQKRRKTRSASRLAAQPAERRAACARTIFDHASWRQKGPESKAMNASAAMSGNKGQEGRSRSSTNASAVLEHVIAVAENPRGACEILRRHAGIPVL
jgi:hypothetical protein